MHLVPPKTRNIFDTSCEVLCCPVNTVGVMGKGLAEQFKTRYPGLFDIYRARCQRGLINTGELGPASLHSVGGGQYVLFFATKQHWSNPSELEWIEDGLRHLYPLMHVSKLTSVAIPPLGCGEGRLDWNQVRAAILDTLGPTSLTVELYEP